MLKIEHFHPDYPRIYPAKVHNYKTGLTLAEAVDVIVGEMMTEIQTIQQILDTPDEEIVPFYEGEYGLSPELIKASRINRRLRAIYQINN